MEPSTSDLLDWRNGLYRGKNMPIEAQLHFVEERLRQDDVIAGGPNYARRISSSLWDDDDE